MTTLDLLPPTILNDAHKAIEVCGYAQVVASLDSLIGEDIDLGDRLADDAESVETTVCDALTCEDVNAALRRVRLTKHERRVITLRFGLGGATPLTFKAIGSLMGCSREQARKLERSALAKLREAPAIQALA